MSGWKPDPFRPASGGPPSPEGKEPGPLAGESGAAHNEATSIDPAWLKRAAFAYLQRYAASEAQLRRVLSRKIRRRLATADLPVDDAAMADAIAAVIADCRRLGFVDDRGFAEAKAASGRRKGLSAAKLSAALAAKGVEREVAAAAIAAEEVDDARAALVFARRRRLGPWRTRAVADAREADRRDLAALCRNGFSLALARRLIGLGRDEAEAALAGEDG